MNGAGTDDDEEAVVFSRKDILGLMTRAFDKACRLFGHREVVGKNRGGDQRRDSGNAEVVGIGGGHGRKLPFLETVFKSGGLSDSN